MSGLSFQTLVQYGAPLFVENKDQETPCDSAEKGEHGEIALYLESKMVFSVSRDSHETSDPCSKSRFYGCGFMIHSGCG